MTRAFIQARMSSRRFPGKVLAPLHGRPVIAWVVSALEQALPRQAIVALTSTEPSDDPLAIYLERLGVATHRGPLDDVFARFRGAAAAYPCDWFIRVCADSPLLDPAVVRTAIQIASSSDADLVTNVFPRTFAKGMSVEMVRTSRFLEIDAARLAADQKEHVTGCYYDNPGGFRIRNFESPDRAAAETSLAIDSIEDLQRLERVLMASANR
jgi:spore coat polysaccharide biosynthesis protein SpsF